MIGAVVPFRLIAVAPANRRLMGATTTDAAGPESRALLVRWGRLHAVRTALALAAVAAYFAAFLQP